MKRLLLAVCVVLALGWSPAATAQERRTPARPEGPDEGVEIPAGLQFADLKLGPFYLQPRATIREFGWDSNITGRPDNAGATSDFRATPGAGVRIALPIRERHMVTGDGQLDYLWFAENGQLRTFNGALNARYEYTSDRFEALGLARYIDAQRTQTDLVEIGDDTIDPEYEIFEVAREETTLLLFDGTFFLSPSIFLSGDTSRRVIRLQDVEGESTDLAARLDRTEETLGGSIGYRLTAQTSLALVVDWINYDFEDPASFRDAEAYTAGAEASFGRTAGINGFVFVGYRDMAPRTPGVEGFEGVVLDGEISAHPGSFAEVTLFAERSSYPTVFRDNIYYVRQGAGVSLLAQAARNFGLGGEVSLFDHSYPVATQGVQDDGSLLVASRLDRVYRFLGRVSWQQSSSATIGFRAGWVNRASNFDFANTSGFLITSNYEIVY